MMHFTIDITQGLESYIIWCIWLMILYDLYSKWVLLLRVCCVYVMGFPLGKSFVWLLYSMPKEASIHSDLPVGCFLVYVHHFYLTVTVETNVTTVM